MPSKPKKIAYSYIRFSHPDQLKGDSLRRQLEASRRWAAENAYELDESMQDLGVSAWQGRNRKKGRLADFLKLVEQGKVPKGTALIVENLDRFSRDKVQPTLKVFLSILEQGIKVVALQDNGRVYTDQSDTYDLMASIMVMARANEESETKSKRIREAQKVRRGKQQSQMVLGQRCPGWLRWDKAENKWVEIPEKVEVVRLVYQLYLEGRTQLGIARILNSKGEQTLRAHEKVRSVGRVRQRREGWDNNSVKHLLASRCVLGEFQPRGPGRVPDGPPVAKYYPQIIKPRQFNKVQVRLDLYKGQGGGRRDHMENIFGVLARCHRCDGGMSRAVGSKPWQVVSLKCNNGKRGVGDCRQTGLPYGHVERAVLLALAQRIDAADLLGDTDPNQVIAKSRERIADLEAQESEYTAKYEALLGDVDDETRDKDLRKDLLNRANTHLLKLKACRQQLQQERHQLIRLELAANNMEESLKATKSLIHRLNEAQGDDRNELRRKLSARLHELIERIRVNTTDRFVGIEFKGGGYFCLVGLRDRFRVTADEVIPRFASGFLRIDMLGDRVAIVRYDDDCVPFRESNHDEVAYMVEQRLDELGLQLRADGTLDGARIYPNAPDLIEVEISTVDGKKKRREITVAQTQAMRPMSSGESADVPFTPERALHQESSPMMKKTRKTRTK